ncbi:carbamoyltransferase C-terminal domain-containing protein [Curtobacterium sp. BRD11]|uniref:carbamoyltransferase C-terminal domain-containing protein n=1 Tax=Curtobacterium sp. BRD11 TaxID=2962581 RepID=UPI002881CAD5|nr:carbamoyltransferase C-terminal domain-containing protein [Curtobacterium sp. BRD11]MDT0212072.1 carbamoyltransferase C-terminal domain-containing protein [Curtobacterium sp. BRD11]
MKDGYYLSVYVSDPGLAAALEAWPRHDHNVSLWKWDGETLELKAHWEFERLSGMKGHGVAFRDDESLRLFVSNLLADCDLDWGDIQGCWGTPSLQSIEPFAPWKGFDLPLHSLSHLATAIFSDTHYLNMGGKLIGLAVDDTPDLVLDGGEHQNWYAGCWIDNGELHVVPIESPAPIYSEAVHVFGRREGTLMALASACTAWMPTPDLATFREATFFGASPGRDAAILAELVLAARATLQDSDPAFSPEDNLASAVMKQVEELGRIVLRRDIIRLLELSQIQPSEARLALAGGYALNCPTNTELRREFSFAKLQAPPCVSDVGQAYGLGLLGWCHPQGDWPDFLFPGAYLGREHPEPDLSDWVNFISSSRAWTMDDVVSDLKKDVIGWFQGRSEIGPRALGNRSILGDPRTVATKDRMNEIKRREWWRPVSPVALESEMVRFFESQVNTPYMLETVSIRPERVAELAGVSHLDSSARVQSVSESTNSQLADLLRHFDALEGMPIVANTSMNDKDEPIVDTPQEAIAFCLSRGIGVLYVGSLRLELRRGPEAPTAPLARDFAPFVELSTKEKEALLIANGYPSLSMTDLMAWLYLPELHGRRPGSLESHEHIRRTVRQRFARDEAFRADIERRLGKRRYLDGNGRPVFSGGWIK